MSLTVRASHRTPFEDFMLEMNGMPFIKKQDSYLDSSKFRDDPNKKLAWVVIDEHRKERVILKTEDLGHYKPVGLIRGDSVISETSASLQAKVSYIQTIISERLAPGKPKLFMTEWFLINCKFLNKRLSDRLTVAPKSYIDLEMIDGNVSRRKAPPVPPRPPVK